MNSVSLIGNLATDVDLRDVGAAADDGRQRKVASFLLAVDRESRDAGADFVWVSAWERQGELCAQYLGKGSRVAVDGRLKSRTWEQDGKRRDAVEVVARRVEFLTAPERTGPERTGPGRHEDGAEVMPFEAVSA